MMKSICILAHNDAFSRDEFQAYYEDNHAPLGIKHFPFAHYVRNHLIDAPDIGFDTISEFWAEDIVALGALMEGPVGEILRADERRFMDQSKIAPAGAEEHVLSEGVVDGDRYAVLLRDVGDTDALISWARKVADRAPGVSLDLTTSWREPAFPAQAVLWTPDSSLATGLPAGVRARVLKVRRVASSAAELAGAAQ